MFLPGVKSVSSTEKWNLSDMLLLPVHVIRTQNLRPKQTYE